MAQRRSPEVVAENVAAAIRRTGNTVESVAEATDLDVSTLTSRLNGETEFNFAELIEVGGFLRIRTESFYEETPMADPHPLKGAIALDIEGAAAATSISGTLISEASRDNALVTHYAGRKASKPLYRPADLDAWVRSLPTERGDNS